MKNAIYEIWTIAKKEEVDLSVAVNMFYRNCCAGEEQYIGTGEYDYKNPINWGVKESRAFDKLYWEKNLELAKAFNEGDREKFEEIVSEFFAE